MEAVPLPHEHLLVDPAPLLLSQGFKVGPVVLVL